ncbi:multiple epidermal growth factor-like domains protein 10 [Haliotis rubra]|uniref:multiple epidermal growth factor-like domains protein 10 n=1 Tax=Haliotis rubra TaxID=36100 RepID=UPI001EE5970A|nr:multiple epidermal growth factor-like domains protein 10 [Haliotis rubra]
MQGFFGRVDHNRVCYQWSSTNRLNSPVNISCDTPTRGQHVTVQLPTLVGSDYILSLCEVEIYECTDGSFGPDCGTWCYCRNTSEVCDKITGYCESGCKDGYTGTGCQELCADGSFGPGCRFRCYCRNTSEVCDKTTGHCESGCKDGNTGMGCRENCPKGRYGSGCMETCGHCAGGDGNCYEIDGYCTDGCQDNWSGTVCKECSDNWFGDQCDMECRCKNRQEVCDKRTGQCHSGCEDGWTGLDCHKPCQDGTYGFNCTGRCGRCQGGQTCDKIGGECQTCAPGFKPPFCQECDDYFYGEQCSSRCGHCRGNATCNNVSGDCPDGCEPGWQGMMCHQEGISYQGEGEQRWSVAKVSVVRESEQGGDVTWRCGEACPNGTFGPACSHQCGQCLGGHVCDKGTGECPGSWCERGWKGLQCLTDCNGTGFYGYNCNETCGMCVEEVCDPITGECPRGCRPKYVGATCNLQQPSNSGGHAGAGVAYAFAVVVVVLVIIAMYFLRRRKQRKSNTDVAAASPDVVVNQAYPGKYKYL